MPSINFLRERRRKLTKQQLLDQQVFKIASIVCGISVVVLVVTVSARLTLAYLVNQTVTEQNRLLQNIRQQESNERTYLVFAAKLKTLSELLEQRQDKQQAINYFSTIFGEGVLLSDVSYDGVKGEVTFGLQAADVFVLERVIATLKSDQVQSQFAGVKTEALNRNSKAEYRTLVKVTLDTNDPQEAK